MSRPKAKNVVLNVSEMEAKVREATNDEPWGASSTLMQEIAQGTFNFQNFNEIMPSIYARFMEKEAKQWRQIYKALQLLEYLVKNGSERVVDDARSHIATIKMLRNFYYIDEKGKDQGINVRNRAKELVELLGDVEKIRTERRKAKQNKHKYIGTGNDALSFSSGGSRYGGFGSESLGYGASSSSYGGDYSSRDYDNYGGSSSGGFRESTSRRHYTEYTEGDDDTAPSRRSDAAATSSRSNSLSTTTAAPAKAPEPAPAPVVDLLGMDDDFTSSTTTAPAANASKALPAVAAPVSLDNDDEFGGFEAAPTPAANNNVLFTSAPAPASVPLATPLAQPAKPVSVSPPLVQQQGSFFQQPAMQPNNLFGGITTASPPPMNAAANRTSYMTPTNMTPTNMGNSVTVSFSQRPASIAPALQPTRSTPVTTTPSMNRTASQPQPAKSTSAGGFDDLWKMGLSATGGSSAAKTSGPPPTQSKSIKDLEREKAQAGIWGQAQNKPPMGAPLGSFGSSTSTSNAAPPSSSGNGIDDLLF
ncbi:ENTH-domain-containing protein [Panus rudis PR-1116 ss-1]|nr:ENTH-domain-containing protein [Panus rudis PR-1116 ss-1]